MGYREGGLAVLVQLGVEVDVVDIVLVKDPLAALVLALDRDHGPVDLVPGQVRDLADQVGQPVEKVRHAAALIVDDEKADVVRAEVHRQGQHIGLQGLGLAGACGAGHQTMGAVVFLMDIQIAQVAACPHAPLGPHVLVVAVLPPALLHAQLLRAVHLEHLQEGEGIGDIPALLHLLYLHPGQTSSHALHGAVGHLVEADRTPPGSG